MTNELGFINLSKSGGSYGSFYRTEDGGKTFSQVELPECEFEVTYPPVLTDEAL